MSDDAQAAVSKAFLAEVIPRMEGWLSADRAKEMYDLVRSVRPDSLVEIGVFGGRSLLAQAAALKDNGKGRIIGIDPWKREAALEQLDDGQSPWWMSIDLHAVHSDCMETIWNFDLDPFVTIIRSTSQDCAHMIPPIDILYIDGNHTEVASCRDVNLYLPKVKQNGYIWFDDCQWTSTQKALAMVQEACVLVKDCGDYRLYCKK